MRQKAHDVEAWKRMVLQSMPAPAWLSVDAPQDDIVLSTRLRFLRNLRGYRFPNAASTPDLNKIVEVVLEANKDPRLNLEVLKHLSNAERDYLMGCRLISPDFQWTYANRILLLNESKSLSIMVNEEDHLRLQALTAGWSVDAAYAIGMNTIEALSSCLEFAWSPHYGYLAASPFNVGEGRRLSSMFHLIGLAQTKRLPTVLKALAAQGLVARGLFGESSRAIGAFVQVSIVTGQSVDFVGACEYLIKEERSARGSLARKDLEDKVTQAIDFGISSRSVSLADALRILAWVRWGAAAGLKSCPQNPREVDSVLTSLELRGSAEEEVTAKQRADFLRRVLEI